MRKALYLLAIVLVSGLTMSFTLSPETAQALEEYKQIVTENKGFRTYGAESGLKGNVKHQFSDAQGYRWYTSNDNGFKIYRFDGLRFMDVINDDKIAVKDVMLPALILSKPSNTVYAVGSKHLYQWQEYHWKKYAFPASDRILKLREYNDDVYCIGEKGLGSLRQGVWKYRAFESKITHAEAENAHVGKNGVVFSVTLANQPGNTGIYLKQFSIIKTSLRPIANVAIDENALQVCFDYQNELMWIYALNTELLLKYNYKNMLVSRIALEPGEIIQSVATTDNAKNWLISKTMGIIKITELNAEYPQKKGKEYTSAALTFQSHYLDYLFLEEQLFKVSADAHNDKYSLIRIMEPNAQSGGLQVRELENPLRENTCKYVYGKGKLLFLDIEHDKFHDVSRVLILKYPFEHFIEREILLDSESYSLSYNKELDFILHQRTAGLSLVPLVIVCEQVPWLSPPMQHVQPGLPTDTHIYKDKFLYWHDKAWHSLDLRQYEIYGKMRNVISVKGIFWICFKNALLRLDPKTKMSYVYTAREGMPPEMRSVYPENGKLMISTHDAVYIFNEYANQVRLDMPFVIVSDTMKYRVKSKLVLPYTLRRLEVPISILGPLYPELCPVSYRLLGFDDDWTIMVGQAKIRYARLPIGSYVFEVFATAANGIQTPVQSFSIVIRAPWYYKWGAVTTYILLGLVCAYLIFRWRMHRYKETNRQLELLVAERTHELQEWQLRMTQSIDYALLIQKSILPQEEQLQRLLKDHFLLWHPRDTVGGDFYWLHEIPDSKSILFAVIDCTGHGVPGALVSMTVNSALNHIVKDQGVNTPEDVLKQLHQDIGRTLHQESEKTQQDGLDISLLKIDFSAKTLSFAGAALDMLLYEQDSNELVVLKGSKYSIGGLKHRKKITFEPQQISFSPNSKVYLYTDGILDQTYDINLRMKRLGPEQWNQVIREICGKSLRYQKDAMEEMIKQMLLLDDQRDDITVVCLQL